MQRVLHYLQLSPEGLAEQAIYLGDNLGRELICDAPGMVHIFDRLALTHDFRIYQSILNFLDSHDPTSFGEAFQLAYDKHLSGSCSFNGVDFLLEKLDTREVFEQRKNYADYADKDIRGISNIILVKSVCPEYRLGIV